MNDFFSFLSLSVTDKNKAILDSLIELHLLKIKTYEKNHYKKIFETPLSRKNLQLDSQCREEAIELVLRRKEQTIIELEEFFEKKEIVKNLHNEKSLLLKNNSFLIEFYGINKFGSPIMAYTFKQGNSVLTVKQIKEKEILKTTFFYSKISMHKTLLKKKIYTSHNLTIKKETKKNDLKSFISHIESFKLKRNMRVVNENVFDYSKKQSLFNHIRNINNIQPSNITLSVFDYIIANYSTEVKELEDLLFIQYDYKTLSIEHCFLNTLHYMTKKILSTQNTE